MRKYSLILSAVAVTGLTVAAKAAPESVYWFDIRNNVANAALSANQAITSGAVALPFSNGQGDFPNDGPGASPGQRGWGQVLRLCPDVRVTAPANPLHLGNRYPNFDADSDARTGDLWLYSDVLNNQDSPAGTNDVISSIGLDIAITPNVVGQARFGIDSAAFSWQFTDASSPVNFGSTPGAPVGTNGRNGVSGAKYVKVPVNSSSLYATSGGFTPGAANPYKIAKLRLTAGQRNFGANGCTATGFSNTHALESTFNVAMSVNNLLITRTFSTGGNASPEERVSFGYTGGAIEADVSGNSIGGAGIRDAVVQVRLKGDTNGNGFTNTADLGGLITAQGGNGAAASQSAWYLYNLNGDNVINTFDLGTFVSLQTATAACP